MRSCITLKNGTSIVIRPCTSADAGVRHAFFVELSLAQEGMVHTIDEIDYHVLESAEKIDDFLKHRRGLWLVAEHDKTIIGEVDITINHLKRVAHNGKLTIGVIKSWQGLGLGSALMTHALDWAQSHGLTHIELSVFASNVKARALYQKFGFAEAGIRPGFIKHEDGSTEDDIAMAFCFPRLAQMSVRVSGIEKPRGRSCLT